jgi:hypothetical protein
VTDDANTNPRLGAQIAYELAHVTDSALCSMTGEELAYKRATIADAAGMLIAQIDRLGAEADRRELAAKMSGDAVVNLLVRIATELGHPPTKRPFFYPSRGEWAIEWADRALGLDGEAFLQLEGAELEYFIREEIAACLAAPARDPEQR